MGGTPVGGAVGVGDDEVETAGSGALHVRFTIGRGSGAADRCGIKSPLVAKAGCAAGSDVEDEIGTFGDNLALRLENNEWRTEDGERGGRTGDRSTEGRDNHVISSAVWILGIGAGESGVG